MSANDLPKSFKSWMNCTWLFIPDYFKTVIKKKTKNNQYQANARSKKEKGGRGNTILINVRNIKIEYEA